MAHSFLIDSAKTVAPARSVESRDPATGAVWARYEASRANDVAAAVARARAAQPAWARTPVRERARIAGAFHDVLYDRRHEVAETITRENGKATAEALVTEVVTTLDQARFFAGEARRLFAPAPWTRASSLGMWRKRVRIEHAPFGVVAVISPWNYPFMLAAGILVPALLGGNSVVLKPSELTPATGLLLGALLSEAGVPASVVEVLVGDGETGAALVHESVDKVFFTGSVATGRRVAIACAERLVPCVLELGGSDPAIVLEDADIETAASGIAWGRFSNAGQTCTAPKRVFVVDAVYDRFLAALARTVCALRVGPGAGPESDVSALIRPAQAAALRAQLDDAIALGARVVAQAPMPSAGSAGGYAAPTVLADATLEMRVLREETFGPLLPVVRVRDEEEAIARANDSVFGLSASVWTRDADRALRVASRLEAGSVAVNDSIICAGMADVPHGGVKSSGSGRAHGTAGLLECVQTKTVVIDRFSAWRQPWWFGYSAAYARDLDGFVQLAHAPTLGERAAGLARSVRLLLRRDRPLL